MKVVVQVRLLPDPSAAEALEGTLRRCNEGANVASRTAWHKRCFRNYDLRGHVYGELKAMGLASQAAQHSIKKAADAYKGDCNTMRRFRPLASQPFDDRCLSWQLEPGTVSIWTVGGRLKAIPFVCAPWQADLLASRRGESDLVYRDGKWFLYATCEIEEAPVVTPQAMLGVDLGIVNIATTSDGARHGGSHLNRVRHCNRRLRAKLQRKGTKSARRLLRKRRLRERRFATDTNHCISKQLVAEAERTGRGIALEDLEGIRERVRLRKPQRATLHSWAFHQLGQFVAYKARRAGIPVIHVDPAYTSQTCSECGHVARSNRLDQARFRCASCGFAEHADVNAARNIAVAGWAAVNQPDAAPPHRGDPQAQPFTAESLTRTACRSARRGRNRSRSGRRRHASRA